jgi:DNA-binding LacI/PurR family transcriptional regulator
LKNKVTLQHIADRLHLSRTTISLAVRDHPRISKATKDKIRALVRKMGYEPDLVARSLATGRSSLIGVVVPDSTNAYYSEVIRGIEAAANSAGYSVVLANGSYDLRIEAARMSDMIRIGVAGIIAAPAFTSEKPRLDGFWSELRRNKFPFVLLNRQLKPTVFTQVSADNISGMRMAVDALAFLRHRRVAYLYGKRAMVPARQRLEVFRRFSKMHRFEQDEQLVEACDIGPRGGYEACKRLWAKLRIKPTAIMALSDGEAIGVLRFLKEKGIQVPHEVSVMGFDGFDQSAFTETSLSTVVTPMHEIGKRAVELLHAAIQSGPGSPKTVLLPVKLALRESLGPALYQS